MRSYLKYVIFLVFLILCFVCTYFYVNNVEDSPDIVYTSELFIYTKDNEYEVKINNSNKTTIFRENDVEEVIYTYPREGKARIVLPDLSTISGEDVIYNLDTVINYTYNVSYEDGYKYIKYLIDNGYTIEMYISNSQFLEVFLKKDSNYRRVALFLDSMMVCDLVDGVPLPNVWDYLKGYNYNDYIEHKFNVEFEN